MSRTPSGAVAEVYDDEVLEGDETVGLKHGDGEIEYNATVGLERGGGEIKYNEGIGLLHGNYEMVYDGGIGPAQAWAVNDYERRGDAVDAPNVDGGGGGLSPKQKAKQSLRKKKINSSTRKKLAHMGKQLMTVLLTCAMAVGSMAEEAIVSMGSSQHSRAADCLEVFAGHAEISAACAKKKMAVLRPRDLRYGDDLRDPAVREEVLKEIEEERPKMVWIAPPCTHWCAFSRLNYTKQERRRLRAKDKPFVQLVDDIMVSQKKHGGHVVVENPATSDLWKNPVIARWMEDENVTNFNLDMCEFELKSVADESKYLKKGTQLMATHPCFEEELGRRCSQRHEHRPVQGKDTGHSAH